MRGAVVEVEYPGVEAGGLGGGLRVVVVRRVKLLGVVAREVERALPRILQVLVAYPVYLEEVRLGVGEGQAHRGVVDHVHRAALPESQGLRKEVGVHDHVVVGEGDVRGGERHAVRPLGALPQLHGEDAEVVAEVPSFQQPRTRRDHVLLQERQRTTADEGEAPRRCRVAQPDGAAVLSGVGRMGDVGVVWQAIVHRRQVPGCDQRRQHGRFLVGAAASGRWRRGAAFADARCRAAPGVVGVCLWKMILAPEATLPGVTA